MGVPDEEWLLVVAEPGVANEVTISVLVDSSWVGLDVGAEDEGAGVVVLEVEDEDWLGVSVEEG